MWREFAFMHHQVLQSIDPRISLEYALTHWLEISEGLAEPPRQRMLQMNNFFNYKTS